MKFLAGRIAVSLVTGLCALLVVSSAPSDRRVERWFGAGARPRLTFAVTVPAELDPATVAGLEPAWRRRLDGYGLRLERRGAGELELLVFGATRREADAIEAALMMPGHLEFRPVINDAEAAQAMFRAVRTGEWPGIRADVDGWRHDETGRSFDDYYLLGPSVAELEAAIAEIQRRDPAAILPPGQQIGFETVIPHPDSEDARAYVRSYVLGGPPVLDGSNVAEAMLIWDPQTNRPEVQVALDADGTRRFGDYTARNTGQKMAILLNGEVKSAPVIQSAITGGRSNISMGGGSADEQQRNAEALVAVLASRVSLPTGITARLTDVTEPSAQVRWGIRFGLAAVAGVIAWLLAGLIARRTVLAPVIARPTTPRLGAAVVPAAITAGLLLVVVLLERISLPWLASWVPEMMPDRGGRSVVALGIAPVLSAFYLVEVIALVIPSWRVRRRGTPVDRMPIDRAVGWLTVLLAALQGWFIASYLQSVLVDRSALSEGLWVRVVVTATLVGGVMLLAVIASAISRAGLINGWLALAALAGARTLVDLITAPAPPVGIDPTAVHVAIAGLAVVIVVGLAMRRAAPPDHRRLPLAGIAPLLLAPIVGTLLAIPYLTTIPGIAHGARWVAIASPWRDLVAAVAVAIAWSWPRRGRADSHAAIATSVIAVGVLGLLPMLLPAALRLTSYMLSAVMLAIAIVELLAGLARRIRMPDGAVVIAVHDVDRADEIHDALEAAGIPAACGGVCARAVLRFFGPYLPIVIYVPASRLDEAIVVIATEA